MKSLMLVTMGVAAGVAMSTCVWGAEEAPAKKEKEGKAARHGRRAAGWKLGMQAWTFHTNTLFEAIDKTHELGLKYMELIPGQALSPEQKDVKFDENASQEQIKKVQDKLKAADIQAICYGVAKFGTTVEEASKVFEFAKKMGITTIGAEPDPAVMKTIDKLANEYEINVAIHNHPKPSHYWNPDTLLEAIKGCGKRIGACADTGHWTRSGLDPMECLKKLEGRVLACHFKDLNEKGPKAHDVVWGTGVNDAKGLLAELKRQHFDGPLMIEYEYNWDKSMPEIKQCIEFFNKTVRELRGQGRELGGRKTKPAEEK